MLTSCAHVCRMSERLDSTTGRSGLAQAADASSPASTSDVAGRRRHNACDIVYEKREIMHLSGHVRTTTPSGSHTAIPKHRSYRPRARCSLLLLRKEAALGLETLIYTNPDRFLDAKVGWQSTQPRFMACNRNRWHNVRKAL